MTKWKKTKISRQGSIYRVALAGIASALALLLVWLSVIVRYGTLGFFAAAGIVLMIPLAKKYYFSAFFAYAVSAGLSVLFGDIASVMAYIVYFGPMSLLIGILVNKGVKWWILIPVQAAYAVGVLALLFYVFKNVIVAYDAVKSVEFWVVAAVGTPVLVGIGFLELLAYKYIVPRITDAIRDGEDKNKENKHSNAVEIDDNENPFEEFDTYIKPVESKNKMENDDNKSSDKDDENGGEE